MMIELILYMALIGLVAWLVTTLVPMPAPVATVIVVLAALVCVMMLIRALGLDVPVPKLR